MASSQNSIGNLASANIALASPSICWIVFSAGPFWLDLYGTVGSWVSPYSSDHSFKSDLSSAALSILIALICMPVCLSTLIFQTHKSRTKSEHDFAVIIQAFQVALSTSWPKYSLPLRVLGSGPHASTDTSSKIVSFQGLSSLQIWFHNLESLQTSHGPLLALDGICILFFRLVTLCRYRSFSGSQWANLLCQSLNLFLIVLGLSLFSSVVEASDWLSPM